MEKSIRRDDLGSPMSDFSSPDLKAVEKIKRLEELEYVNLSTLPSLEQDQNLDHDDEELSFRLFASTKPGNTSTQSEQVNKVRLRSPTPTNKEPGFMEPNRKDDYYFTSALTASERAELSDAAMSGKQISGLSVIPWPGVAYPWKVLRLPPDGLSRSARSQATVGFPRLVAGETTPRRRRPGQKARIKLRVKVAEKRACNDEAKAALEAKEAVEREKKKRKNRDKKAKKRLRDKAKKAEINSSGDGHDSANTEE